MRSPTTSRKRRRPRSSRPSTTSSPKSRAGPSRSFPGPTRLGTRMQSVGEVMAIGRTFRNRAEGPARSRAGPAGLNADATEVALAAPRRSSSARRRRLPDRIFELEAALRRGVAVAEIVELTGIDPWFIAARPHRGRARRIVDDGVTRAPTSAGPSSWDSPTRSSPTCRCDRGGMRAAPLPQVCGRPSRPSTPARPSSRRRRRTTTRPTTRKTRCVPRTRPRRHLGSGPNRIGQGIEFDYCCVHASMPLARRRLRDRDDQLQPRDGLDRLRHVRSALLRAADRRGAGR